MAIEGTAGDVDAPKGGLREDLSALAKELGLSGDFFRLNRREAVLLVRFAAGKFVLGWVDGIRFYKYLAIPLVGLALFIGQPLLAALCVFFFFVETFLEWVIRRVARRAGGHHRLGRFDDALSEIVESLEGGINLRTAMRPWKLLQAARKGGDAEDEALIARLLGLDLDLHSRRLMEARAALANAAG
jgi:hypothetical protein